MTSRKTSISKQQTTTGIVPFESAEQVWFWFISAQEARNDGARFTAGQGLLPRPCEPVDVLRIVDRLYRQRRLMREHLLVLRHYGRRHLPPDRRRIKEMRAYKIWTEALARMESVFVTRGIVVRAPFPQPEKHPAWFAYEGMAAE